MLQISEKVANLKVAQSLLHILMLFSDFYHKNCLITAYYSTLSTVTANKNLLSISALNLLKGYNATISNKNQDVLSALL